ncbi:DUF1853 family protein [Gallaecimonas kandeliae]|uniref:DUF1853 family protein n=1 Tax=Gallaecimonas kandeliae TaxID=3029055 RepID=UPI0026480065|nr:DUF1853 family protein [Gallaecimonas kandeliae]WKE63948.1 DUF1853 family protein [Gallaecimonas kandeliae]
MTFFSSSQCLAMLDWVANSPPLLDLGPEPELPLVDSSDLAGLGLRLGQCRRLGQRFELLVAHLIEHNSRYRLLARDLPIRSGGLTLGAPDLIVEDCHSGDIEHWELTVKFYLGLPEGWLGPGRQDWLEDKAEHLRQHQLPLLTKPAAEPWLAEKGWRIKRSRLLSRGLLFGQGPRHPYLAAGHGQGLWFHASALPKGDWYALPRWQWLAKLDEANLEPLGSERGPVMIVRQEGGQWRRHFLVPDGWPAGD